MARSIQMIFDFLAERTSGRFPAPRISVTVSGEEIEAPVNVRAADNGGAPKVRRSIPGDDHALTGLARKWSADMGLTDLSAAVSVRWNPRLKTTAGTACPRTVSIDLNCKLETFGEDVVMRILKHELAHLIAHRRAGRRRIAAHGMEWRQACTELGIPGEKSRHTLPFQSSPQRRKFAYQCPECGEVILRVRKLARYSACWPCCKADNRGQYTERFQLVQIPIEKGMLLVSLRDPLEATGHAD